jgi:sorting nexin-8
MTDRERDNYVTGYHILETTRKSDYTCLSKKMGAAISVLLEDCLETFSSLQDEQSIVSYIQKSSAPRRASLGQAEFQAPFEPLLDADSHANAPAGRALSFAHPIGVIAADVAPYVRAIVSYDLQLEQRRLELSGLLGQDGRSSKRMRTTRASRAALEGGSKATTRRERWFTVRLNAAQILATGGRGWQELCSRRESALVSEASDGDGASSATMMSSEEEI